MHFQSKIIKVFIAGILLYSTSWSLPAPLYLSVEQWKNCVHTQTRGQAKFICLPAEKPKSCPAISWKKLRTQHLIPLCN